MRHSILIFALFISFACASVHPYYTKLIQPELSVTVIDAQTGKAVRDSFFWLYILRHPGTTFWETEVFNLRARTGGEMPLKIKEKYIDEKENFTGFGWGWCIEADGYQTNSGYFTMGNNNPNGNLTIKLCPGAANYSCSDWLRADPVEWLDFLDQDLVVPTNYKNGNS